jgi:hypothetical protein
MREGLIWESLRSFVLQHLCSLDPIEAAFRKLALASSSLPSSRSIFPRGTLSTNGKWGQNGVKWHKWGQASQQKMGKWKWGQASLKVERNGVRLHEMGSEVRSVKPDPISRTDNYFHNQFFASLKLWGGSFVKGAEQLQFLTAESRFNSICV